tara:strand:- start:1186 stop:2031 length:846 start_codon:yes stop_codon:yes gene_type:complete
MESLKNFITGNRTIPESISNKSRSLFNRTSNLADSIKNSTPVSSVRNTIGSTGSVVSDFSNKLTGNSNNIRSAVLSPLSQISNKATETFNRVTTPITATRTVSVGSWFSSKFLFIGLLIFVLGLLGLNVFTYLTKGTDIISYYFSKSVNEFPNKTKEAVKNTLSGVNLGTDIVSGMVKNSSNIISDQMDVDHLRRNKKNNKKSNNKNIRVQDFKKKDKEQESDYKESKNDNKIQEKQKPGYCYIGTDRGYRSCIKVSDENECLSKEVYPTMNICINPNLRV